MKEQRKLAAIMFTDIVGYSALMSKDEKIALQILSQNRTLQKSALSRFHGEFIKEIGDGTLSIFQSSWDAVSCAMELQHTLNEAAYFQLRIGIHIGDIVVSAKDVFGDGVNIASRIQAICEPGSILISEIVYNDIRNKTGIKVECIGEKLLKNIDAPVKVYAVSAECFKRISEQHKSIREVRSPSGKAGWKTMHGRLTRKLNLSMAAAIIMAVIFLGGYFLSSRKQRISTPTPVGEKSRLKANKRIWTNSIAVLPFTDLSPEKDQEYFCDGMAEELINVMTHIPGLKVVARTSAFSFKGKEDDIREIGDKLDVKTILEGSVRKSGNQLRISTQLIDVRNGYHLWSQNYDRELKDVFAIQDEIATAIVDALKTKLLPADKKQTEKKQTVNTEAYELYLKGLFYWNKRTADALQKSIDYFDQAIVLDPSYSQAYAGLASAYVVFPEYSGLLPRDFIGKAMIAAQKASELDPALAEPHAVLGLIKSQFEYDMPGAEAEFIHALELNPGYPTTHHWYSNYLRDMGRLDQSLDELQQAQELDPFSLIIIYNIGINLWLLQQFDQAKAQCEKIIELDPDFPLAYIGLAVICEEEGKFDEAIAMHMKARKMMTGSPAYLSDLGRLYIKTGREKDAMKILDELLHFSKQGYQASYQIASLYFSLGDRGKTFEWLEKSYEDRESWIPGLKISSSWDSLRPDPRFITLLRKTGLEK
jgi:TolB-like protein